MSEADDVQRRRAERAERAREHVAAQQHRREQESAKAQAVVDEFVTEAARRGIPTEELRARPYSGRGTYRTGVEGWYVRRNRSIGVGVDGGFYVLNVAPVRFGRWRRVPVAPTPPPLEVGRGGRDGEAVDLEVLLAKRLRWEAAD